MKEYKNKVYVPSRFPVEVLWSCNELYICELSGQWYRIENGTKEDMASIIANNLHFWNITKLYGTQMVAVLSTPEGAI